MFLPLGDSRQLVLYWSPAGGSISHRTYRSLELTGPALAVPRACSYHSLRHGRIFPTVGLQQWINQLYWHAKVSLTYERQWSSCHGTLQVRVPRGQGVVLGWGGGQGRGGRGGCCQSKGCGWVSCCLWVVNGPSHHWRCSCVGNFFSAIQQRSFNWFWSICKWQQMMIGKTKTDDHSPIPPNQSN